MVNNVQKALGYRDLVYNISSQEFWTTAPGDNYRKLDIEMGVSSGGTNDKPSSPNIGELYWDTDLNQLVIWNGSIWEPVGSGTAVNVPSGPSADRPGSPEDGDLYFDTTINSLLVYNDSLWNPATPDDVAVLTELVLQDKSTGSEVVISVRNGALIVTDPLTESVSEIDLGGTTPDPGTITNLYLNGTGQYTSGNVTAANANGLATLEYINTPGQFFTFEDIGGPGLGPGDRQGFGLVRETIYDRTDLSNGPGVFDGGNGGGWSLSAFWYYTGGYPYLWTSYTTTSQTPGGSGNAATGTFGGQTNQKNWWELCIKAGVGQKFRVGIADGADQAGTDYGNRLIMQVYVSQELIDHPEAATLLPAAAITNGVGWYTCYATTGEYENMGQFPDGNDKGYRFRWSTFGNSSLNQLPYVTGVSNNDQITAASGQSHYVVYDCAPGDKANANSVLSSAVTGANNRLWTVGTTVDVLQFNQPYAFPSTPEASVFEIKYSAVAAVMASPLFVTYPVTTADEIIAAGTAVAPLQSIHQEVCDEIRNAVTAYYLVRDFDSTDTALVNTKLGTAITAALGGQLINTYDAVAFISPDDSQPEGSSGEVLFPLLLKLVIQAQLSLYMNKFPDN